jgi:hypothetical protein
MHSPYSARSVLVAASLLLVSACGDVPALSVYQAHGTPESLLDISSEVVSLSTATPSDVKDLSAWIERDHPSHAQLSCATSNKSCADVKSLLEKKSIPYTMATGESQSVSLVYERIVARDCNPRYVDNVHNFYNTNHPAFGCAVAANMVQHVTDKQEFVNPSLSDDPSAVRGVNDLRRAYKPRPVIDAYKVDESLVGKAKSD